MKIILQLGIMLMMSQGIFCQKIEPALVSSSGGYNITGNVKMHWAIGESAVATHQNGLVLTEGFFQAWARTTSVYESGWDVILNIYPNPASERLHFSFEGEQNLDVAIIDLLGRKVLQVDDLQSKESIDISSLVSGQYLIRLQNENHQHILHKFIKI